MRTVWLKRAKTDLDIEIGKIAEDSPKNALMVLKKLTGLAENLYYFPYKFPKEPIYNKDNVRFAVKFSYKIVYRVDKEKVVIMRVFNSKRDPRKI